VAALYAKDALKVASFPTLLLITTLFRLALNVSSTRLALLNADAGEVIRSFGEFAVQGQYVVGFVIFAILTLVQFLVVAKGAERVSEVAARFTLDAMPGKQMSIDADLRAGAISQAQARARRRALERESQLFGAMDGAMKFVKGDAIAGIVIVAINLLGGLAIGVLVHGMTVGDAAKTYFLLAIGDGLVSQIPAICIAVAAGLVVTRVASESDDTNLGMDIGAQFFSQPRALYVVSGLLFALGLLPGMPVVPFGALCLGAAALGYTLDKKHKTAAATLARAQAEAGLQPAASTAPAAAPTAASSSAPIGVGTVPLLIDLSGALSELAKDEMGRLASRDIPQLRDALFLDTGLKFPAVRVRQNAPGVAEGGYVISIDEVPCARGALDLTKVYTSAAPGELNMLGIAFTAAKDPVSGRSICAVDPQERDRLLELGAVVRTPRDLLLVHLAQVLRRHAAQFLGVQETQALLDGLEQSCPALVRALGEKLPPTLLTDVLRSLVDEGVSIRNMRAILEALADPSVEGDPQAMAERARVALKRHLSYRFAPEGTLLTLLVDPAVEETVRGAARDGGLALAPGHATGILDGLKAALRGNTHGVILASPDIRRSLRRLIAGAFPDVAVLTFSELNTDLAVKPVGKLAFARAA